MVAYEHGRGVCHQKVALAVATAIIYGASASHALTAEVSGYAKAFVGATRIPGALISASEDGGVATVNTTTDSTGRYSLKWPVGKRMQLSITADGYHSIAGAAPIVTSSGLSGLHHEYTFQTPRKVTYEALKEVVLLWQRGTIDSSCCHVITTVCAENKTLLDDPQGEAGATIELLPAVNIPPFYFGIIAGITNPFSLGLLNTSADGGAAFFNVPVRKEPYTLVASKNGVVFSDASFYCTADKVVNISPPLGPTVISRFTMI